MIIFGGSEGRGCFTKINVKLANSKGATMEMPGGGFVPSALGGADAANPFVITSVALKQDEAVAHIKCFNDAIYTYAFGADTGDAQIEFLAFLTTKGAAGAKVAFPATGGFGTALKTYADSRISASKKPVRLVMGINGGSIQGQLIGMQSQTYSSELNIQRFSFVLKLVNTQVGTV